MNDWLENHRTLVLAAVGVVLAAAIGAVAVRAQPAAPLVIEPPPPTPTPGPTSTPAPLRVYVSGAVREPDVYTLPPGAIVRDVVEAAGGPLAGADIDHVNLAHPLADGDHVHIPVVGEAPTPAPAIQAAEPGTSAELTGPLNINTATAAELELLPGIGPALAERIIAHREAYGPFASVERIQDVSGIGPAKFDAIRELIVTE